jgi:sugar O-acyltransferase (sialic acid O-acetyltransferase NeuD family)
MNEIIFIGFGCNAKVILELCYDLQYKNFRFFDDNVNYYDTNSLNYKLDINCNYIDNINNFNKYYNDYINNKIPIIITISNIKFRQEFIKKYPNLNYINLIHPSVYLSPSAMIKGKGNIFYRDVIINSHSQIGSFNQFNNRVIIEHDNNIGDNNIFSPSITSCGCVTIKDNNFIGAMTCIKDRINIDSNNVIGCNTNIIKNIKSNKMVFGNPGKVIKNL